MDLLCLSLVERQKRIAEGGCYYGGGLNHIAEDCPSLPSSLPPWAPIRTAELATTPVGLILAFSIYRL